MTTKKPRETKAQRDQREAAEAAAKFAEEQASYLPRLLKVFEACSAFGWPLRFDNGSAHIRTPCEDSMEESYELPCHSTPDSVDLNTLINVENDITHEQVRRNQAIADALLRKQTLAKLNAEELRVLGIKA